MLDAYVRFYLKPLAPYLVVGQEIEFVLNVKAFHRKKDGEYEISAISTNYDTGNTVRFKVLFSEELKKELELCNATLP